MKAMYLHTKKTWCSELFCSAFRVQLGSASFSNAHNAAAAVYLCHIQVKIVRFKKAGADVNQLFDYLIDSKAS